MSQEIKYPITIVQGVDFYLTLTLLLSDKVTPRDLTGYTGKMQIRRTLESDEVIAELTTENGGIQITAGTGVVLIHIPAADSAGFEYPAEGVYSLHLINGTGAIFRKLAGPVTFEQDATREAEA